MITALLEIEGWQVLRFQNGTEALEALHDGVRPCLILLDLMMPGMNGWQFRAETASRQRAGVDPGGSFSRATFAAPIRARFRPTAI